MATRFGIIASGLLACTAVVCALAGFARGQDQSTNHSPVVVSAVDENGPEDVGHSPGESDPTDHGSSETAGQPGHGGGHDETDLSHQNASSQQADPTEFRADLAIWTFVVFILLLLLLAKFAWKPILDGLQKREQSVAAMIERAKQDAESAAKNLQQYELKLAGAIEESREIIAQARREAEQAGQSIIDQSRVEAERQLERAKREIDAATNAAVQQLARHSVDTAVDLAGRLIHKEIKPADHTQLIREAIDQFPSHN
jgi:F-type H+-transporting ATPase subunit b